MGEYIIPAAAGIIIAIIEYFAVKDRKKATNAIKCQEEKVDNYAKVRAKESQLAMRMYNACLDLSIATANALTDGNNNGKVEKALAAAEEAQNEYNEFLQRVAAKAMTK